MPRGAPPGWTGTSQHDPGIVVLELLALTVAGAAGVAALRGVRSRWRAERGSDRAVAGGGSA